MSASPEYRARLVLARVIAADFAREKAEWESSSAPVDWLHWAVRLHTALRSLVEAIDAESAGGSS